MFPFPLLDDEPRPPAEFALVRVSRRAMATTFEVAIPTGRADAIFAAEAALDLIDDLEDQLTVYRDLSEVCRLNAAAAERPVEVESHLFDLLARCAGWTCETDGAFDIATGALIKAWGFYRRAGRVPTPRERAEAMAKTGTRHVILNPESRSVKYRVPGLEINLGAVGKGYALDRAAELLRQEWGIESALLHAGGSSVFAIGCPPGEPRGWPIALTHPWDAARPLGTLFVCDAGLGTSAATFQYFEYNGRKLGHLLDPRTGWPAEGCATVSVIAPTAAEADAMSTAAFVLGAAGAEQLARTKPHLAGVVLEEGNPTTTRLSPPSFVGKGAGGLGSSDPTPNPLPQRERGPQKDGGFGDMITFNLGPATYSPPADTLT